MNEIIVNYDDLTEDQLPIWDAGENHGYDIGYDEGYDTGYHNGYQAGIEAEQNRIQSVLGMMFESALNMGQGTKAVQYKHAMDLLRPINIKPVVDEDF